MIESEQLNNPGSDLNKNVTYQTVATLNGVTWIIDGYKNFATSPFIWVFVVFLYMTILGTLSIIPFVSIISIIIAPIFMAGLMICARENKYNQTFFIKNLFDGFTLNGGKLAVLGAINLGIFFLLIIFVSITVFILFLGFIDNLENIDNIETIVETNLFIQYDILLALIILLLIATLILPVIMAFWFAPALIVFHDVDIFVALKLSFMGYLKNILPYSIYSSFFMIIFIIAVIPIIIIAVVLNETEPTILQISLIVIIAIIEVLVFVPVFFTSIYASYEDIFLTEK
ncbi:MAG: BPSS1780 family membrane protein [Thiohalomonadales bacterium]